MKQDDIMIVGCVIGVLLVCAAIILPEAIINWKDAIAYEYVAECIDN